eukprot:s1514_g19.t1
MVTLTMMRRRKKARRTSGKSFLLRQRKQEISAPQPDCEAALDQAAKSLSKAAKKDSEDLLKQLSKQETLLSEAVASNSKKVAAAPAELSAPAEISFEAEAHDGEDGEEENGENDAEVECGDDAKNVD